MTKEKISLTNLNEKIKETELTWISDNQAILFSLAEKEYNEKGRGFVLVNTNQLSEEQGHLFWYLTQAVAEELKDVELKQMIRDYDPLQEFILVLEKKNRDCSYHQVKLHQE